jgi:hypothetical protein
MSDFIHKQPSLGLAKRLLAERARKVQRQPDMPTTREELRAFVKRYLKLDVPDVRTCPDHQTPMDYLVASLFEQRDLLVWANRGGGKTFLAAVATVIDGAMRAPIDIRILGGSYDQSDRLADYIRELLALQPGLVEGVPTRDRVSLVGGSRIAMLPQSQRAVRGQHVQRIRCDEVDLFDPDVWQAVQFATRSKGDHRGSIEVLSTLHRMGGLMDDLVARTREGHTGYDLVQWCVWEVIERCGPERSCAECPLAEDCIPAGERSGLDVPAGQGIAKLGEGFFHIEDAIAIKSRSSRSAWEAEMLCSPRLAEHAVFGEFDPAKHVRVFEAQAGLPVFRAVDFGYRDPFVCLWVQLGPEREVRVLDEYLCTERPITHHANEILRRHWGPVKATFVDPAGNQRESTSGAACTELLASMGIPCTSSGSTIHEGIELIRAALAPATGEPKLLIHPRCEKLIESFRTYHYAPPGRGEPDRPVKDGPDHAIDALRYFFVNRWRPNIAIRRARY